MHCQARSAENCFCAQGTSGGFFNDATALAAVGLDVDTVMLL
jgi:hypothetical protein